MVQCFYPHQYAGFFVMGLGLDNNHACKWIFDNFPGMLLFLGLCLTIWRPLHCLLPQIVGT